MIIILRFFRKIELNLSRVPIRSDQLIETKIEPLRLGQSGGRGGARGRRNTNQLRMP